MTIITTGGKILSHPNGEIADSQNCCCAYNGAADCSSSFPDACADALAVRRLKVVVAGTTAGDCDNCDAFIGTYIFELLTPAFGLSARTGKYFPNDPLSACDMDSMGASCTFQWGELSALHTLEVAMDCAPDCGDGTDNVVFDLTIDAMIRNDGTYQFAAKLGANSGGSCRTVTIYEGSTSVNPLDCVDINDVVIPFECAWDIAGDPVERSCYFTSGSVTITSIPPI